MAKAKNDRYLTKEEIDARIQAVTTADCIRLERMARVYADGTGWLPADLLQEAFVATLSRRRWRADLELSVFMMGVMRSLAFSRRKSAKHDPMQLSSTGAGDETENELRLLADAIELSPSELVVSEQDAVHTLEGLAAWFESDVEILAVLRGRIRGDSPTEIRTALRMNQTQYESVCRRMLRGYEAFKKART